MSKISAVDRAIQKEAADEYEAELTQLRATVQRLEAENAALKDGLEQIWLWLAPGKAEIPDVPRARVNIGGIVMRLTADKRAALESKGEVG